MIINEASTKDIATVKTDDSQAQATEVSTTVWTPGAIEGLGIGGVAVGPKYGDDLHGSSDDPNQAALSVQRMQQAMRRRISAPPEPLYINPREPKRTRATYSRAAPSYDNGDIVYHIGTPADKSPARKSLTAQGNLIRGLGTEAAGPHAVDSVLSEMTKQRRKSIPNERCKARPTVCRCPDSLFPCGTRAFVFGFRREIES